MVNIDAFKKAGYSFEETNKIIKSNEDFLKTGKTYSHNEIKELARKELFSKASINV